MLRRRRALLALILTASLTACEPGSTPDDASSDAPLRDDAPVIDAGPVTPLPTDHCTYAPLPATARAGGTVTPGAVRAGVAIRAIEAPIGVALGGNTSRANLFGSQGTIDARDVRLSGSFTPSVGIETIPHAKALAITAGEETVVLLRTDLIFADDTITHEVTERLGPELAGKVIWTSTHSHTAPGSFSADLKFQVGAGPVRAAVRGALIEALVAAAEEALASRVPARIGIATNEHFDPEHHVSYDRRDENDDLFGGQERADERLAVIRVDRVDGEPLAIVPIFGVHSAILDDDVAVFSTDASGAFDHAIEEQFDREVLVMHVQGAAGDVLGASHGHLRFADEEPQWDFARNEECARFATAEIMEAWERAGSAMQDTLAMEMVTRSVEMGPSWETFTVRGGALSYAPWDGTRACDRVVFEADGLTVASPIDEFNAPGGASLCGDDADPQLPIARLPNTEGLFPYGSCASIPRVTRVLGPALSFEFGRMPICSGTRTTVGAWRLGDFLFGLAPGEPVTLWRDAVVARSPFPPGRTFVIGYALGHNGYLLTPEDWLRGGYEPSINSWGPLEGEYLGERIVELLALAATDVREDAAAGGADRVVAPSFTDTGVPDADPAPRAGEIPETIPTEVWMRRGIHPLTAQPSARVERVTGVARFVWIGEDPMTATPHVRLEREVDGVFQPVVRRSGRVVEDRDLLLVWTPLPLLYTAGEPRTHYWTLEWQAVSWEHGVLEDRAGLPLGRYRFHVEGRDYVVDSAPFEVVPGAIDVHASVEGTSIAIDARYQPREGWRLLDLEGPADHDVPVLAGPLEIELLQEGGGSETQSAPLASPGIVRVTPSGSGRVIEVIVRDRFGNEGRASP
ncbi:MAG: neutral/alkaline non-lysosomal ceramidase N-terminal domain-containing protein [Sandaracinus sp.]